MSRTPLIFGFASILALASVGAAGAQTSGQDAAAGSTASSTSATPVKTHKAHHTKPPSTSMDVGGTDSGTTPTGPYTSTEDAPAVSDLTGSVGASSTMPAAPPPPGVTPPNGGAPDTGGAETPNTGGGPHG